MWFGKRKLEVQAEANEARALRDAGAANLEEFRKGLPELEAIVSQLDSRRRINHFGADYKLTPRRA